MNADFAKLTDLSNLDKIERKTSFDVERYSITSHGTIFGDKIFDLIDQSDHLRADLLVKNALQDSFKTDFTQLFDSEGFTPLTYALFHDKVPAAIALI